MNKKSMWESKNIHDFCLRDIESCHHAAARCVNLWSLNANLVFEEPRRLTKFALLVHLNHIWQRTLPFRAVIAIFWDLQPLRPSSLMNPNLLRSSLQNEVGDPHFFKFLTSLTHLSMVKFSEKNQS